MIDSSVIPEAVLYCLSRLEANGFEAWLVGGAVRDLVRGQTSTDWDIATSATPPDMLSIFKHDLVIPIGLKHGTVRVILADLEVDITTYRVDGPYQDGRRPEHVSFGSSIHDDLSRRDFTINALAYHPSFGLIDPFGGLDDIKSQVIRAVGDPEKRIHEDHLRMMRAFRFAAVLGFMLDWQLERAIIKHAHLMANLPLERLGIEWTKLLAGERAATIIANYMTLLKAALPESSEAKPYLAWRSIYKIESERLLRFVSFSLALDLPERWFDALVLTKDDRHLGRTLRRLYLTDLAPEDDATVAEWRWCSAKIGLDALRTYFRLRAYMTDDEAPWLALIKDMDAWQKDGILSLRDLVVDGDNLLLAGVPSLQIGHTLERLFKAAVSGKVKNERESLLAYARLWYNR